MIQAGTSKVTWELFSEAIDACKVAAVQSCSQMRARETERKKLPQPIMIQIPWGFLSVIYFRYKILQRTWKYWECLQKNCLKLKQ